VRNSLENIFKSKSSGGDGEAIFGKYQVPIARQMSSRIARFCS